MSSAFETRFSSLREWPEKKLIFELTGFAEHQIDNPKAIVEIIMKRLFDLSVNPDFLVSVFYLIDSIVRNIGGPYINLFSSRLPSALRATLDLVSDLDKNRLDYLLSTWEARKIFNTRDIMLMRETMGPRRVNVNNFPVSSSAIVNRKVQLISGVLAQNARGNIPSGIQSQQDIKAFISETLVNVNVKRSLELISNIKSYLDTASKFPRDLNQRDSSFENAASVIFDGTENFQVALTTTAARFSNLLDSVTLSPSLPPMVFGLLPLEPSKEFKDFTEVKEAREVKATTKVVMPAFKVNNIERDSALKDAALKGLYHAKTYLCSQDGLRFETEIQLAQHLDVLFVKNKEKTRREVMGERVFRSWFCTKEQWCSDFNSLKKSAALLEKSAASNEVAESEEMILLADEHFPRCPISKEVFETIWDDEDGDIYYRNAVKVLVSEAADPALYRVSRPTFSPCVRYCIVHKSLVLDFWLELGKATTVRKAVQRYQAINRTAMANDLIAGAGVSMSQLTDEKDSDDVDYTFVLLEINSD